MFTSWENSFLSRITITLASLAFLCFAAQALAAPRIDVSKAPSERGPYSEEGAEKRLDETLGPGERKQEEETKKRLDKLEEEARKRQEEHKKEMEEAEKRHEKEKKELEDKLKKCEQEKNDLEKKVQQPTGQKRSA